MDEMKSCSTMHYLKVSKYILAGCFWKIHHTWSRDILSCFFSFAVMCKLCSTLPGDPRKTHLFSLSHVASLFSTQDFLTYLVFHLFEQNWFGCQPFPSRDSNRFWNAMLSMKPSLIKEQATLLLVLPDLSILPHRIHAKITLFLNVPHCARLQC